MYKRDRAHVEEVYVVGFVPCTTIPNDVPEAFDPFLEPLMDFKFPILQTLQSVTSSQLKDPL